MPRLFENNTQKEPVVTFILGNGFDLSLHMETSYSDVYRTYVDTDSSAEQGQCPSRDGYIYGKTKGLPRGDRG